jgi:hypothetical protein
MEKEIKGITIEVGKRNSTNTWAGTKSVIKEYRTNTSNITMRRVSLFSFS